MDIDLLKTFVEVVKTRHFGRAAENLYITQSAVSFRIRQLEQSLGVNLFIRQRNNIQLTAPGERLLPHAKMILTGMQRAKVDVALANNMHKQLSLSGTANIWDAFLQFGINHIVSAMPGVSLVAEVKAQQESTRLLLERTLDLAVLFDPPKVDELVVKPISDLAIIPVSTFDNATKEDFFDNQYVYVDWGTAFSLWHAKQFTGATPPYFRTSTGRIALDLILQCGGSAFVPEALALESIEAGRLTQVDEVESNSREIFVAYHKDNDQLEQIETIVNLLGAVK
ncbi:MULTISPECIES: LysR family transcriptional regulator [Pseudoalteromonas]|uniref:LysR family transcriptional regulator n=2 Tax=Pseudoalteromonas TaxID=53246 RepID=A0A8I2H1R0_9GAMM|nr:MULTISPECIES: LysR family transcriptional regulator [Pseudoalteromonas]ASD68319.1 LysR family transcriptional regulator [Pseudoalteromonas piscicida]AUJ71241.1 HTH-type transcriptional regulator CynR [Pseudoalteromonas sp. NC201]AXQ96866.1 LysR family transcriptional regulator [Pseudoalteromonas piscicida]AXR03367.1 LysR family transcriptional regulator [Pseudoalteromonas piscicida]KID37441.1 LysR family transcriptional regulator [Pseudoalteromonas flavipulchra NCIMB 2033 = ATCC BAA-314]